MILSSTQIELLQSIRNRLIRGDIGEIASSVGMTREYVGKVLSPSSDTYNEEIISEAVKIIERREQDTKKLLKKVAV